MTFLPTDFYVTAAKMLIKEVPENVSLSLQYSRTTLLPVFFLDEVLLSGNCLTQKCVVANKAKLEHKKRR